MYAKAAALSLINDLVHYNLQSHRTADVLLYTNVLIQIMTLSFHPAGHLRFLFCLFYAYVRLLIP